MLGNEMILSMLRNVVAGMSFLHSAQPSIIHQELRSPKILLDSSCRAHLSDFQQDTVCQHALPAPLCMMHDCTYDFAVAIQSASQTGLVATNQVHSTRSMADESLLHSTQT